MNKLIHWYLYELNPQQFVIATVLGLIGLCMLLRICYLILRHWYGD